MPQANSGRAGEAINAVSRVLAAAVDAPGPGAVHQALVHEARDLFGVAGAGLLTLGPGDDGARPVAVAPAGPDPLAPLAAGASCALHDLVARDEPHASAGPDEAAALARAFGWDPQGAVALLVPLRSQDTVDHVLVLFDRGRSAFSGEEIETLVAFASATGAALAQLHRAEQQAVTAAEQSALVRAAMTLNASLDLTHTLDAICREAQSILDGGTAAVYRGDGESGLTIEYGLGLAPEFIGSCMEPGQGLSGRVALSGVPMFTNDYQDLAKPPANGPFARVESCVSVPIRWDGLLQGVLSVGFFEPHPVGERELALLEAFAEIAAVACRNATTADALATAARTDGLTGCLNHAAFQDGLRRELERAARTGRTLSVALFDLDDFKAVNESAGHLVGDEALRRVGHALRSVIRPYDLVARYGGDEFALVATDSDEHAAAEIAQRALTRIAEDLADIGGGFATAGVAEGRGPIAANTLLEQADRALLFGKQVNRRGTVVRASELPATFRAAAARREDPQDGASSTSVVEPVGGPRWTGGSSLVDAERLQKRARQLGLANEIGARLAAMTDPQEIADAVVDELNWAYGYYLCAVIRIREDDHVEVMSVRGEQFTRLGQQAWSQPRDVGVIGRCLRERRTILVRDVRDEPVYEMTAETVDVRSELCAPLWIGETLWGAVNIEEVTPDAFDEDDARLLSTVADQLGSAMRSAMLYERLERAYVGTAEALAAALEAKDAYTASHAHSIADWANAVGEKLRLSEDERRDLRYGAIFHDIGKIAVPEAILNKRGPLDPDEWEILKRHTIVGEQILAPVDFLAGVLPTVRHEHERWDGGGYPDGLAGTAIPLGARIVLVCDAYHAMTSDRPYRDALPEAAAREELVAGAGSQFDPDVVAAFLEVLDASAPALAAADVSRVAGAM